MEFALAVPFLKEVESAARYFPKAVILPVEWTTLLSSQSLQFYVPWRNDLVSLAERNMSSSDQTWTFDGVHLLTAASSKV